jgi:RNA polymerase sigma factor (TIGR02999 family)
LDRQITHLLELASAGDQRANDALFESVYQELRTIARAHRRRWHGNETLNTTALISEAYVKLAKRPLDGYRDRAHFFATASRAMRQVLINYAEKLATAKRGRNPVRVTLSGISADDDNTIEELLQIDALLNKLEADNARRCRLFECRVFGGMTIEETATALDVSPATVKRDWTIVSAWVLAEMRRSGGAGKGDKDT